MEAQNPCEKLASHTHGGMCPPPSAVRLNPLVSVRGMLNASCTIKSARKCSQIILVFTHHGHIARCQKGKISMVIRREAVLFDEDAVKKSKMGPGVFQGQNIHLRGGPQQVKSDSKTIDSDGATALTLGLRFLPFPDERAPTRSHFQGLFLEFFPQQGIQRYYIFPCIFRILRTPTRESMKVRQPCARRQFLNTVTHLPSHAAYVGILRSPESLFTPIWHCNDRTMTPLFNVRASSS